MPLDYCCAVRPLVCVATDMSCRRVSDTNLPFQYAARLQHKILDRESQERSSEMLLQGHLQRAQDHTIGVVRV